MGMLGELFPGRKIRDESGEDGDAQPVGQQWDIDLDSSVVRLRDLGEPTGAEPGESGPGQLRR